uniref:Uncharacterized protein n=1 Tax=Ananas comosus var. bracteatus TaxID=296719 RepID=A0A6V7PGH5_ANACO|nr:unnamed protein product [Ananas comosus var. bracteatus]
MTTAARPTWAPAKGETNRAALASSALPEGLLPRPSRAHHPQAQERRAGYQDELQKRNLREELEERERRHYVSKDKSFTEERDRRKGSSTGQLLLEGTKREVEDRIIPRNIDADDSDVESESDDDSDDDDDDDDDTAELMAELEKVKKEKAEEKLRKEREEQEEELKVKEAELMRGNPLINLNNTTSFNVKRRWDDDVVFKNQARGETKTRNDSSMTPSGTISTASFCRST